MGWRAIIVFGIVSYFCFPQSHAQTSAKSAALTIPELQRRIATAQGNSELAASVKEKVVPYLQAALERLEIAQENLEKAEKFERQLPLAAGGLKTEEDRLKSLPAAADPEIANVAAIEELSRMVETREKELDDAQKGLRKQIADLDSEATSWRVRPEVLINDLSETEDRLRDIEDELNSLATSGEPLEVMQAHQLFLLARRQRAESEHRALRAEGEWLQSPIAADLLQAQQEFAAKNLTLKLAELELLEKELGKRRGDEADQRVHKAETVVARVESALKPLAEENLALANEQRDVSKKLQEAEHRHDATSTTLADLQKEFDRTQKMVDTVGLTDTIGLLLRQQRAKLLDRRILKVNLFRRNDAVRETRMRQFQLASDRATLIDLDAMIAKRAEELDPAKAQKSASVELRTLLVDQRQLYNELDAEYTKYFKQLIEMDVVEQRLLELTKKYAEYVDERVLWIRTGQTFGRDHLAKLTRSFKWILDPKLWQSVIAAAWHNTNRQPLPWILAAVFLAGWLGSIPVLSGLMRSEGNIASRNDCREIWPTLQTIAFSIVLAGGGPSLIWFLGWRLDHTVSAIPFVHAVAAGLLRAATFGFPLSVLRVICRHEGLAERHFAWPPQLVERWRVNLSWFLPIGAVLIGLIGIVEAGADEHRLDSFGRFTFLVFAALSVAFCWLTFGRAKLPANANRGEMSNDADVWSDRFWRFVPSLAIATCVGLFALGWSGYFYTALQLTWRLQQTAWFAIGLLIIRATIRRWIALERRRMAVLQDAELQTLTDAGQVPGNSGQNPFLFPRWNWPDFRMNLTEIVTQMRQLLDTGLMTLAVICLCFVWADVTPALNILDRVTLWHTTVEQTVTSEESDHGPSIKTVMRPKSVTAAHLGLAALIVAVAVIAGRNIPGLVEVILLEHLSVDAGIRFAATYLVRYAIFITGVCCAFAQISIGWNSVQWLVAAASVGLGFGLQEIFCNFVSGIILLFERPMRVGDVVTIGDTTGTVSRIRFRATTIVDGDRKELIVPNKEFITGHLLNWTLSDRINRVVVKVVVASKNDPQRVRRLLLEIAAGQPQLLRDPAPSAVLEDVNGGLTFSLRGFLPTLDSRATATHELYAVIDSRFKAEGIELSCPTQEIMVRTETHNAHSTIPAGPHQHPSSVLNKPLPMDLGAGFRRT